jgi:hypothetical protein
MRLYISENAVGRPVDEEDALANADDLADIIISATSFAVDTKIERTAK